MHTSQPTTQHQSYRAKAQEASMTYNATRMAITHLSTRALQIMNASDDELLGDRSVSYTHLTLPTICSV